MKRRIIFVIFVFISAAVLSFAQNNILVLNSTHKGNTFTDRITSGIEGPTKRNRPNVNIYNEYLDLLRAPLSDNQLQAFSEFLAKKYEKIRIDVIVTTDDEGLFFAVKLRDKFKYNIQILFCGVSSENEENISKLKDVNGFYFDYSFETNLDLAKSIFPGRDKYVIIHDSTSLSRYLVNQIKILESRYPDKQFSYLNSRTLEENISFITPIEKRAVVFPCFFRKDRLGKLYLTEQFTNFLTVQITAPSIGFLDYQANRGVTGGYLYVGFKDGEKAAQIIEYILDKRQIPPKLLNKKINFTTLISYDHIQKFKIPEELIPKNAVIINEPLSYYDQYHKILIPYVILIISLLAFLAVLAINIKKRKKISGKLHENEALFRLLTENAKDIIFRFDLYPYPHFKYISPSVKDILGIEPEKIYKDYSFFTSLLNPDALIMYQKVMEGSADFEKSMELEWRLKDKTIWTESKHHPVYDENNKFIAFEGVTRVITEQKEAIESLRQNKERLALVLSATKDGIWDWDISKGEIIIDDEWANLFGSQHIKVSPDFKEVFGFIHQEDYENAIKTIDDYLSKKTDKYEVEFRVKYKSDDYIWILCKGKTIEYDKEGNPIRIIGTYRDISDKKKNELEILKIQKLESLGTLAGGIAHDFNNILTAILGNITLSKMLLSKGKDLNKITNLLENSEKSTFRAKELTQKLLAFSRGGNPIKKIIDMEKVIPDVVELSLKNFNFSNDIKFLSKPWPIEADEDQIRQTLQSVITNAAESISGNGTIKVIIRNYSINHKLVKNPALSKDFYLRIDIIDQGCGIKKENLNKVFDPYYTTKAKAGGLGLSSAYTVIKNHHGHIAISSEEEKGTTVTIYLPASAEQEILKTEQPKKSRSSAPKILVMDDDDFIRELLGEALSSFGYEADMAVNGEEAIVKYNEKFLSGNSYDLVIMDLTIPGGKGGKETIIELKEIDPDVTAIVSSGYSNDPILSNYEEYGFSGIITKPYNIDILKETLRKIL